MFNRMFGRPQTEAKSLCRMPLAIALVMVIGGPALAQPMILIASANPDLPNRFTVNFPEELGGPQSAKIVDTNYILKIDNDAGFASIKSYYQLIDPLRLGETSTGDITVRLGGKSSGTYDSGERNKGEFDTKEIYHIFFEGDLRKYGLKSPFVAPSESHGTVTFTSESAGTIHMEWEGLGEIPNPRDPENPFRFTYECEVNSNFQISVPCADIKNHRVGQCVNGRFRVKVAMKDNSRDGAVVVIDVAGEPRAIKINGKKARKKFRRRTGQQVVNLFTDQKGCKRPRYADCGE